MMPFLWPLPPPRCSRSLLPYLSSSSSSAPLANPRTPQTQPPRPQPPHARPLSTTAAAQRQTPSHLTVPKEEVPAYPYGRFQTYKQRNEGLFGRGKVRFGNTISDKYDRKSRVKWYPNLHVKRLWSPALKAFLRTRLTASVLSTIDRLGGIDEYLLGPKQKRIKELGPAGWALRWKVIQSPTIQARFARERAALGLPPKQQEVPDRAGILQEVVVPAKGAGKGCSKAKAAMSVDDAHQMLDRMLANEEEFALGNEAEPGQAKAKSKSKSKKAKKAGIQTATTTTTTTAETTPPAAKDEIQV